jgi:hypothetical protein
MPNETKNWTPRAVRLRREARECFITWIP